MRLDNALAPIDHLICYAVKANSNRTILKLLAEAGAGFDSKVAKNPTKEAAGPSIHREVKRIKAAKYGQIAASGRKWVGVGVRRR